MTTFRHGSTRFNLRTSSVCKQSVSSLSLNNNSCLLKLQPSRRMRRRKASLGTRTHWLGSAYWNQWRELRKCWNSMMAPLKRIRGTFSVNYSLRFTTSVFKAGLRKVKRSSKSSIEIGNTSESFLIIKLHVEMDMRQTFSMVVPK